MSYIRHLIVVGAVSLFGLVDVVADTYDDLLTAVEAGDVSMAEKVLESGVKADDRGSRALVQAAKRGDIEVAKLLLERALQGG